MIAAQAVRQGVSPIGLLASKYPFRLPDRRQPSSLSVEITDACNLKCVYCTNPQFAFPRTYMSNHVFQAIIADLDQYPIDRVRVCGGEPTLHPNFPEFAEALSQHARYLSVVTNAQWQKAESAETLLRWFDLIEVSVDAGGQRHYEQARPGASFERLEQNLALLRRRRGELAAHATINIRLMIRPSTHAAQAAETQRWAELADCVMPQYVIDQRADGTSTDVFQPVHLRDGTVPRCTMPFKDLAIRSDGSVPVCHVNGTRLDPDERILLGNVLTDPLAQMWASATMAAVRAGHRKRDESVLEFCRGCSGR
jgi:MoaA/NifB/PqqE/SkfB family radical SAM enzyme